MTGTSAQDRNRRRRVVRLRRIAAGATVAVAGVALLGPLGSSADPPDTDPTTAPVPEIEPEADEKSLVATVAFDDRTVATPVAAEARYGAAHSHIGDPPLLKLRIEDADGAVLDELNAWHPLWAFTEASDGSEQRIILDAAEGTFIVPFDRDAATMTIVDVPLSQEVAEIDLTDAIRDFCTDNPTDPSCRVADLAVTRVEATSVPDLALVGETGDISVETDVTNLGPSTPVDATVTYAVTADPGVTVTPTTGTSEHTLDLDEEETDSRDYSVTCDEPGLHDITFTSTIAPSHPADVDPDDSNDEGSETVTVDCVVPITINIKPGGTPSPINVSVTNGSVPVALLTTEAGEYGNPVAFDATQVDAASTLFGERDTVLGGDGALARHGRGHEEDALELDDDTRDGDLDMTIQFTAPDDTGLATGDTEACVLGEFTTGGTTLRFWGCDDVVVID